MGGKKKQITGYKYFLGVHTILCRGPVDEIHSLSFGGRRAWDGSVTSSQSIYVDKPELYGGEDKEGGVQGHIDIMMGEPTQAQNSYLMSKITGLMPAFRGVVSTVFKSFYMGASNPYPKPPEWGVKRIPAKDWLPDWADINGSANPAHIIYEFITHPDWGMGYTDSDIDLTSFTEAAETLFNEEFGLNFIIASDQDFTSFFSLVLDHINAVLYVSHTTSKFVLKLLRAGEEPDETIYNESNCILESYERPNYAELVNEVSVMFRPRGRNSDDSVTVQNLAMIQTQGIVNQSKTYTGIDNAELAGKVAIRDLKTLSTPLARIRLKANRIAWNKNIGEVIQFSWENLNIVAMKLRILSINYGTFSNGEITIDLVEDIFGLSDTIYFTPQVPEWVDPVQPSPLPTGFFLQEGTYWDIARSSSRADLAYIQPESCYISGFVEKQASACLNWELWVQSGSFKKEGTAGFSQTVQIVREDDLPYYPSETVFNFINPKGRFDDLSIEIGSYALLGSELVRLDAINLNTGLVTLARGCLDTVPQIHLVNSIVYFIDNHKAYSLNEHIVGETVTARALIRTGSDLTDIDLVSDVELELVGRFNKPYAPGNLLMNSESYQKTFKGFITLSWAHRNRLLQLATVTDHTFGDITPEENLKYTISILSEDDTEIRLQDVVYDIGLDELPNSFVYTVEEELEDLYIAGENHFVNYPRFERSVSEPDLFWSAVNSYCRFENTQDDLNYVTDEKQYLNASGRTNTIGWRLHNSQNDNTRAYAGESSLYLNGANGWAESPVGHLTSLVDTSQEYTIEMRVYIPSTISADIPLFNIEGTGIGIYIDGSTKKFLCEGVTVTPHPMLIAFSNVWMHVAMTRTSAGDTILLVDGQEHWRAVDGSFFFNLARVIELGRVDFGSGFEYGEFFVDEFRWTFASRYSGPFMPQETQFSNEPDLDSVWASTSLYLQFLGVATSNTFVDRTGLHTITATDVEIDDYVTTPTGLCEWAEFNGTSSALVVNNNLNSFKFGFNDFTIEFHVKANGSGSGVIVDCTSSTPWQVAQVSGKVEFSNSSGVLLTSTSNISTSNFDHIAISSQGADLYLVVNGTVEDTVTDFTDYNDTVTDFTIGCDTSISNFFNGSLSMLRITNGYAHYSGSFTQIKYSYPVGFGNGVTLGNYSERRVNDKVSVSITSVRNDSGTLVESFQSTSYTYDRRGYGFHYGKYYGAP